MVQEQEQHGEFAKASEDVMKKRKIVRPKRAAGALAGSSTAASGSNPFAGVSLTGAPANPFAGVNLTAVPQTNAFAQANSQVQLGMHSLTHGKSLSAHDKHRHLCRRKTQAPLSARTLAHPQKAQNHNLRPLEVLWQALLTL